MRLLPFLVFLLLATVSSSWAAENQVPDAEAEEENSSAAQENSDQEVGESEDLILDEEELEDEGPRRFIPTEQISQDLGVSFPVDI